METLEIRDVRATIQKVAYYLNGKGIEGKKLSFGPTDMRPMRYLILLYLANYSPRYRYEGKSQGNYVYFSATSLNKIANDIFPSLDFDRQRSSEVYEPFLEKKLVDIKKENNVTRFAITEEGGKECVKLLEDLIITKYPSEKDIFFKYTHYEKKSSSDDSLLPLDKFLKRREIKSMFDRYPKFYGRQKEINTILNFLDGEQQILIIIGEGGFGKTRLVLETILLNKEILENNCWNVFFLNPYRRFDVLPNEKKMLLILDNAKRYVGNMDLVLDCIINPSHECIAKLIIVERPIFAEEIIGHIREKHSEFKKLIIPIGEVEHFLIDRFHWVDKQTAADIALKSRGSFDYAVLCAEYHQKGAKMDDDLISILSWKIEKYITDISQRTGYGIPDIRYYLEILSLLMPLDWIQDSHFLEVCFPDYEKFKNVLFDSRDKYETNLICAENNVFTIIPDPIADSLRLSLLENDKRENVMLELVKFFPFRIIYNAFSVRKYNHNQLKNNATMLIKSWLVLNKNIGQTKEYFKAIDTLSYVLTNLGFFSDIYIKSEIDIWIRSFEYLFDEQPSADELNNLICSLFNIFVYNAEKGLFHICDRIIDYYKRLYRKYNEKNLEVIQGICLEVMCSYHVRSNRLGKLRKSIFEIRQLYNKYPSDLRIVLASSLVKELSIYERINDLKKALRISDNINELKLLYSQDPKEKMAKIFCAGLFISTKIYLKYKLIEKALLNLYLLKEIFENYPIDNIRGYLMEVLIKIISSVKDDPEFKDIVVDYIAREKLFLLEQLPLDLKKISISEDEQTKLHDQIIQKRVNYEVHQIVEGEMFLFVLDNDVLPKLDLDTKITVSDILERKDTVEEIHVIINIIVENNGNEDEKMLILCPNRIMKDFALQRMIKYICRATIDPLTDLYINDATIGITNQKGFDILRNLYLSMQQKKDLMFKNDCIAYFVSKNFLSLSMLMRAIEESRISESKNPGYCPYCNKDDDLNWRIEHSKTVI